MQIRIYKNYEALSEATANTMLQTIQLKPNAVICLASGHTPLLPCKLFVQKRKEQNVDISQTTFLGLDEWVGVPPENEGSCHFFLNNTVFNPLGLNKNQFHVFDSISKNLEHECEKMDAAISSKAGIDLMIVGIGLNGHIGFNEPGVSFKNYSHVIKLDEITVTVGQKYFSSQTKVLKGITIGLQHLMEAKKVILIANGEKKAAIIKKTIEEKVTEKIPSTIMQIHKNGLIMLDADAASLLPQNYLHETE